MKSVWRSSPSLATSALSASGSAYLDELAADLGVGLAPALGVHVDQDVVVGVGLGLLAVLQGLTGVRLEVLGWPSG